MSECMQERQGGRGGEGRVGEEERVAGGLGLRPVDEAEEGCDEEQWGHVAVDSSRCRREHIGEGGNEAVPCAYDAAEQGVRGVGGRFRESYKRQHRLL